MPSRLKIAAMAALSCAFLDTTGNALAAGTIPTVGGYSNTSGTLFSVQKNRSEFTTVGIVIQIEGYAFGVHGDQAAAEAIVAGAGILSQDKLWVEKDTVMHIADTRGGYLTVAGPAAVEFTQSGRYQYNLKIFKGSIRLKAADGQNLSFENGYASGTVSGEAAIWASGEATQILGLSGSVKTWHPRLPAGAVNVPPGYYTESAARFAQLHPKKPIRTDADHFNAFLSFFERDRVTEFPPDVEPRREIASVTSAETGSRSPADVVEARSEESINILKRHVAGQDFEEKFGKQPPLAASRPHVVAVKKVKPVVSDSVDSESKSLAEKLIRSKH